MTGLDAPGASTRVLGIAALLRLVQERAAAENRSVVLTAVSLANAPDVVAARDSDTLAAMIRALADRVSGAVGEWWVLDVSPVGIVAAAVVPRHERSVAVTELADSIRGMLVIAGDRVWPSVTIAARLCEPDEDAFDALVHVRATSAEALVSAAGSVRWAAPIASPRRIPDNLTLARDLASALEDPDGQIWPVFQPIRELVNGKRVGAEALVRWRHPFYGDIPPSVMIPLAERNGLIQPLGRLVLDRALAGAEEARSELGDGFQLHVNVSPFELREERYVDGIREALERHAVSPSTLLLELTETALMAREEELVPSLLRLREIGVEIGIDDFGTGHSSISRLHLMPVDAVKIDRSLIVGIARSTEVFDLVQSVFHLLATTGVRMVAEGIEHAIQVAHLRALGCRLGQGMLLGEPQPGPVPS